MAGVKYTVVGKSTNIDVRQKVTARSAIGAVSGIADLTGYTGVLSIYDKPEGNLLLSVAGTISNPNFNWVITTTQLATLGAGTYVYEFLVTYPSTDIVEWAQGNFTVS